MTARAPTGSAASAPNWRQKLHAWWEGYKMKAAPAPAPVAAKPPARAETAEAARARISEALWGAGFDTPGGAKLISSLIHPLGLDVSITVLVLGAELGGTTRVVIEETGAWVEGFDTDPRQLAFASAHAMAAKLGEKARFADLDPERPALKAGRFGAVICKDWLYRLPNRRPLLRALTQALRPGGLILITDYVLLRTGPPGPATSAWYAAEGTPIEPWLQTRLHAILAESALDVRVAEDMTPMIRDLIAQAFARLQTVIPELNLGVEGLKALRDLLQLWAARQQVLASGEVGIYRYLAQRTKPVQ